MSVAGENLERAATILRRARSVVVFTGAGVSAESGVPTYRSGADGLWSVQNMERYANPDGYARHLPDSFAWYRARASGVRSVEPNAGHVAIARLAQLVPRVTVVTQNIDSLHQRAGSAEVIELHGHLRTARCAQCDARVEWQGAPDSACCVDCGGMLRPEVVMFREMLPPEAYSMAVERAAECDVLLSVGTSNQVFPAAEIPRIALEHGAWVFIVNPDMEGQPLHIRVLPLRGRAGEVLPALLDLAWPATG